MDILNGTIQDKIGEALNAASLEASARFDAGENRTRETRRKCGSRVACNACLDLFSDRALAAQNLGRAMVESEGQSVSWRYFSLPGFPEIAALRRDFSGGENSFCQRAGSIDNRYAFPSTGKRLTAA